VQKITFLSKKVASYKGKSYTFYLYHVVLDDDQPEGYLAIAGGYKTGSTSLETAIYLNGVYWKENYSAGKINTQFNAFIKNREEADDAE
jgi:hypothetical protein